MSFGPEKNHKEIRSNPTSLTYQFGWLDTELLVAERKYTRGKDHQSVFLLTVPALEDEDEDERSGSVSSELSASSTPATNLCSAFLLPALLLYVLLSSACLGDLRCSFPAHLGCWMGRAGRGWLGVFFGGFCLCSVRLLFPVTVGSGVRVGSNGDKCPTAPYISACLSCCRLARWLTFVNSHANQMQIFRI